MVARGGRWGKGKKGPTPTRSNLRSGADRIQPRIYSAIGPREKDELWVARVQRSTGEARLRHDLAQAASARVSG